MVMAGEIEDNPPTTKKNKKRSSRLHPGQRPGLITKRYGPPTEDQASSNRGQARAALFLAKNWIETLKPQREFLIKIEQ
jgi:hypothetical protein